MYIVNIPGEGLLYDTGSVCFSILSVVVFNSKQFVK